MHLLCIYNIFETFKEHCIRFPIFFTVNYLAGNFLEYFDRCRYLNKNANKYLVSELLI